MTYVLSQPSEVRTFQLRVATTAFGRIVATLRHIEVWRQRRRAERMIESMPLDMRKDLGWPTSVAATGRHLSRP